MNFMKFVLSNLDNMRQQKCILVLDEVYVMSALQYHGGIYFGKLLITQINCQTQF